MSYIVPQKMPLRCFECGHISSSTMDGYSCKIARKSLTSEHGINIRRPDWCPLVEIPTPHGRLVDIDKMIVDYWDAGHMEIRRSELKEIQTVIEGSET